jgi:hypothetical protein
MTTAKWTSIQERSRIHAILLQDLMRRGVCWCGGGDALRLMFKDSKIEHHGTFAMLNNIKS